MRKFSRHSLVLPIIDDEDTCAVFKARMLAQISRIDEYRRQIARSEGRELSRDEAAREWIHRFAEEFGNSIGWR